MFESSVRIALPLESVPQIIVSLITRFYSSLAFYLSLFSLSCFCFWRDVRLGQGLLPLLFSSSIIINCSSSGMNFKSAKVTLFFIWQPTFTSYSSMSIGWLTTNCEGIDRFSWSYSCFVFGENSYRGDFSWLWLLLNRSRWGFLCGVDGFRRSSYSKFPSANCFFANF